MCVSGACEGHSTGHPGRAGMREGGSMAGAGGGRISHSSEGPGGSCQDARALWKEASGPGCSPSEGPAPSMDCDGPPTRDASRFLRTMGSLFFPIQKWPFSTFFLRTHTQYRTGVFTWPTSSPGRSRPRDSGEARQPRWEPSTMMAQTHCCQDTPRPRPQITSLNR